MPSNRQTHDSRRATDIALRARLCLFALQTPHAQAFHLGNIVRIAFVVAYFARDAADDALVHDLIHAERILCGIAARASDTHCWRLANALDAAPIDAVLHAYEQQLSTASADALYRMQRAADANFAAPTDRRQSIRGLLE
jgi:hypothetical protein